MRASTAKASRQQIRKAFGPEATSLVEALALTVDTHTHNLELLRADVLKLGAFTSMGLWQRLRWVLCGR